MTDVELDGTLTWGDMKLLPRGAAIYLAFDDDCIYYIGCTTQLHLRMQNHAHRKRFNKISGLHIGWIKIRKADGWKMRAMEGHLIRQFEPQLNNHIPKKRYYD